MQWIPRTDVGTPGERYGHAMAYDSHRGVTVFFGGAHSEIGGEETFFNDTWEYNGRRWTKVENIIGGPPTHRANHAMCYDSARRQIVLTGGRDEDGFIGDTWVYSREGDGPGVWTEKPHHSLPFMAHSAMVFDEQREVAVLAGGYGLPAPLGENVSLWEVWEWNGTEWRAGIRLPNDRSHHAAAYDSLRGIVCLQAGVDYDPDPNDLWYGNTITFSSPFTEWDLRWGTASSGSREEHAMVYDSRRDRLVLFGGKDVSANVHMELAVNETWRALPIAAPPGRAQPAMVYDSRRGVTVLFGGVGGVRYADTWELVPVVPLISLLDAPVRESCEFGDVILRASVTAAAGATLQWRRDGFPIRDGNSLYLTLSSVRPSDEGEYTLRVTDPCGNVVVSAPYTLVVHSRPTITAFDTVRRNACPGDTVRLTVSATSTLPIRYQWYKGLDQVPGATGESLTLSALTRGDTGSYSVAVINNCGTTRSEVVHLQVGPSILQDPQNISRDACAGASFFVLADGVGTLRYQWRLDRAPLNNDVYFAGATSSSLAIQPVLYAHEGKYDVIVTDDCGAAHSVTSRVATLTVTPGPQWFFRTTNGPAGRFDHTMVYDSDRGVTVLFGGVQIPEYQKWESLGDLWEWDGARWLQRVSHSTNEGWMKTPTTRWQPSMKDRPVHRYGHMMAYDSARGRVVLFGGETRDPDGSQLYLNDLWEWDGASWHFRGTNGPASRSDAAMTYDPARGRTILFGGFGGGYFNEPGVLWEWDGEQWHTNNLGMFVNYSQSIGGIVYDSFRAQTVFGPTVEGGTAGRFYDWDGSAWTYRMAPGFDPEHFQMAATENGALAYDSYRRRTVWFGGRRGVVENKTGFFDGEDWTLLTSSPVLPAPRSEPAMAYDSRRHAVVMFGGDLQGYSPNPFVIQMTNDTWELVALDTPLVNDQPASQYRRGGETAAFTVSAVGPGVLRYQWMRNGVPIQAGPRVSGLGSPTLDVANVESPDAGMYRVVVQNDCGESWSLEALLTLRPDLQIFATEKTATLMWSDGEVLLEAAETAAGPWTAVVGAASPFRPALLGSSKFFRLRAIAGGPGE